MAKDRKSIERYIEEGRKLVNKEKLAKKAKGIDVVNIW